MRTLIVVLVAVTLLLFFMSASTYGLMWGAVTVIAAYAGACIGVALVWGTYRSKRSDSLQPRFDFLRRAPRTSTDVSIASAITTGFERGTSPLFRSQVLLSKAIAELGRDEAKLRDVGDDENADLIAEDIKRLKAVQR